MNVDQVSESGYRIYRECFSLGTNGTSSDKKLPMLVTTPFSNARRAFFPERSLMKLLVSSFHLW